MLKTFVRLFAVAAFAVAAAIPMTASAAGGGGGGVGITVSIGQPITLQSRLLVTVPVTITCTSALPNGFGFGEVDVQVQQAFGETVNSGFGFVSLTSCPSSPQTFLVAATPQAGPTAPAPFHGGPAIVFAGAGACDTTITTCIGGSAGPQAVHL